MRNQIVTSCSALLLAACASPAAMAVPDTLKPGANEALAMIVPARGVQIYECRAKKDASLGHEWAFVAPEAELFDVKGNAIGGHASVDGSTTIANPALPATSETGAAVATVGAATAFPRLRRCDSFAAAC